MYTYAFFKTPQIALQVSDGIAGVLQVMGTPVLSALVEPDLDFDAIEQDDTQLVQAVLTHDRVICDLFWQTTILPLRFGTQFVSEERLINHLEANQVNYLGKLNHLEGKAEYRLKLLPIEDPIVLPSLNGNLRGRELFPADHLNFHEQQQRKEFQQVLDAVGQNYPNYILREPNEGVEKLYVLVDRQDEMTLYQHLHEWQRQCPHWELELGEALPPYHFV